jgi:5-methylcytosine-specific restriction protein A
MKISTLKPAVQLLRPALKSAAAGDQRIRGAGLQKIRQRILMRDGGMCRCARCQRDGVVRDAGSFERGIVDHIIPLWAGGRETDENRQAISRECHDLKSAHEARCRAAGHFVPWDGRTECAK